MDSVLNNSVLYQASGNIQLSNSTEKDSSIASPSASKVETSPPEELLARLLFASDEGVTSHSDEELKLIWSETFPLDPFPQEQECTIILEKLRKVYPASHLKRNDEPFRVLKRK